MTKMITQNEYSTMDFGLAAFLLSRKYRLVDKTLKEGGKVWFTFVSRETIAGDIADYFSAEGDLVSASAYNAASRTLSRIIRDAKNGR